MKPQRRWTRTGRLRLRPERRYSRLSSYTKESPFPPGCWLSFCRFCSPLGRLFSWCFIQAAVTTTTTVLLRIGEAFASASNNGSNSANNNNSSSRRRRAARRGKTGRTRIGRILKCRFAGGRRFRPARTRRNGRGSWARGHRSSEGELLVIDDDSARIFRMVLAFLRGGAKSGDQQPVCACTS